MLLRVDRSPVPRRYGSEYDYHSNPLSAEALAFARRACAEAARHGLGVFLYINRRHLEQHMPGLARALRAAGAAGLKFGFVNFTRVRDVEAVVGWAYACLVEGLAVNVHDDLIPAGLGLLLPNLLSFEAVLGNEGFPPPLHTVRLGLVRGLAGPADYTPVLHHPRRGLPLVHLLSLPVLVFCPLQHLFFYSVGYQVPDGLAWAPGPEAPPESPAGLKFARSRCRSPMRRNTAGGSGGAFRRRGRGLYGSVATPIPTQWWRDAPRRGGPGTCAPCAPLRAAKSTCEAMRASSSAAAGRRS